MNQPRVSVIIPIYGVEKYIERCAISLFEQTLADIEYIFINDCTKDHSIDVLNKVIDKYPHRKSNVKIVNMLSNSGQAAVREYGTKLAVGEYLIHCDSDDWVDVNMYEMLYNKAKKENLDIVWCDYYRTDGVNHKLVSLSTQPRLMQGPLWNKLVRRSLYFENNVVYPKANKAEDGALMTQISFYSKSRGYVSQPLYYYYVNQDSICGQISELACLNKLSQEIDNTDLRINFLMEVGKLKEYEDAILLWKFEARKNLLPILNKRKYRCLWRNTYPEINKQYLLGKNISLKSKLKFILLYIGLY